MASQDKTLRPLRAPMLAAFAVGTTMGIVAGCQTYDFEPVVPVTIIVERDEYTVTARNLKPNLMLLVDKSLSMNLPANNQDTDCQLGDGGTCGGLTGASDPCNP